MPGLHSCPREGEDTVFDERKRGDVRLLLATEIPKERVAQQVGFPLRTVHRIAREMREERLPAEAEAATADQSSGPGGPSVVAAH